MGAVKAVLFDVDGTLLDTKEFVFQAFEHTFKAHGLPKKSREEISRVIGKPLEECYQELGPSLNPDNLCETHRLFQEENLQLSSPFPNARKTLISLKKGGFKIAAVTNRSRRTSKKTLKIADLFNYIDVVVSAEDVKNHKPNPEPLLKALAYLEMDPKEAVLVGDTRVDIAAGRNAGLRGTIGVTYSFSGRKIIENNPDFVVDDIAQVAPIIEQLKSRA